MARVMCEWCGSTMVVVVKKGGRTIEIIKHEPDCKVLKEILEKEKGLEV
jgi:hypothetical protein